MNEPKPGMFESPALTRRFWLTLAIGVASWALLLALSCGIVNP